MPRTREIEKCFQCVWDIFLCLMEWAASYLTFYEDSDETANGIHQAQMSCLKKYELDIKHITAYAADNANVNFGKCHSVSQLLSSADSHILKANCPAHIAHNTCKHACDQLSVDIESLVLKIYSRFSVSASREGNCVHFLLLLPLSGEKFCFMFACDGRLSIPLLIVSCRAGQLSPHTSGPVGETCPLYLSRIFEDEDKTPHHCLCTQRVHVLSLCYFIPLQNCYHYDKCLKTIHCIFTHSRCCCRPPFVPYFIVTKLATLINRMKTAANKLVSV